MSFISVSCRNKCLVQSLDPKLKSSDHMLLVLEPNLEMPLVKMMVHLTKKPRKLRLQF